MDRRDLADAATLMTLLHGGNHITSLRAVLPGWDMLQADIPTREQIETAASILVGSGLAEVGPGWGMSLTEQGAQVRASVKEAGGMRLVSGAIRERLEGCPLSRASLSLPESVFDAAWTSVARPDAGPMVDVVVGGGRPVAERRRVPPQPRTT